MRIRKKVRNMPKIRDNGCELLFCDAKSRRGAPKTMLSTNRAISFALSWGKPCLGGISYTRELSGTFYT
jgi:hypothetical protein